MWSAEDDDALQMAGDVLEPQIDEILETWYGFIGDHDFLLRYFTDVDTNEPIDEYLKWVSVNGSDSGFEISVTSPTTRRGSTTSSRSADAIIT